MTHQIIVENIKCGGCMHSIQTALQKIEGLEQAHIDLETETITVTGTVDREVIVKVLSKLGYPEIGKNDLLKKAKSFVSCAVGKIQKPD